MINMKILFLTNVPSPYRVEFFNQLGEKSDLTVLYQKKRSSERDKKWVGESRNTFKSIYLNGVSTGVDQSISFDVLKYLDKKKYDFIVICGLASPTEVLALTWCKVCRIPYYFESDGGFAKTGKGIKEYLKRFNLFGAQGYFSTGNNHDLYYLAYGVPYEKIIHYPFSSITSQDIRLMPVEATEKKAIRRKHGYDYSTVAVTVGQFIYRKGIDVLIKAWSNINQNNCLVIVGGEPTKDYLDLIKENNNKNIYFVPFVEKNVLAEYYAMADFFVLPTREDIWGLVVNEAMCFGLPVISSNRAAAALEMIEPGCNGYLFENENILDLEQKIQRFLNCSNEEKEKMSYAAICTSREYTIEKMVDKHLEIFKKF